MSNLPVRKMKSKVMKNLKKTKVGSSNPKSSGNKDPSHPIEMDHKYPGDSVATMKGCDPNEVIILDDEPPELRFKEAAVVLTRLPNPEIGSFTQIKALSPIESMVGDQRKVVLKAAWNEPLLISTNKEQNEPLGGHH